MVNSNYDVLLWGVYFCDLIFTGLPTVPRLGAEVYSDDFTMTTGGPFTTTVALQRLGVRVGWLCDFGNDSFSQFVLKAAKREEIDSSLFQIHPFPVRRITAAFSFAHDRGFISFMDEIETTSAIPFITQHRPRLVLLPGLYYGPQLTDFFALVQEQKTPIFMDCQGTEATLDTPGVREALQAVDIFAPNEVEAMQLTGTASVEAALDCLAELTPLVVIKLGPNGAIARRGNQVIHEPAIQVPVVDTTGAGDCFNAGFLARYLQGDPLPLCLRAGNVCGGLSTTAVGGAAVPDVAQFETYFQA